MFRHLPRHTFGYIQGKLFPKYFLLGTILSSVTLLTYIVQNPFQAWEWQQRVQVCAFKVKEELSVGCPQLMPMESVHVLIV